MYTDGYEQFLSNEFLTHLPEHLKTDKVNDMLRDIFKQYEYRPYHNLAHLYQMVRCFTDSRVQDWLRGVMKGDWYYLEFICFVLFHDVHYLPEERFISSEALSARTFFDMTRKIGLHDLEGFDPYYIADLIKASAHFPSADYGFSLSYQLFLDIDMAILGADEWRYSNYMRGIAREYSHLTFQDWMTGRSKFLTRLLEEGIFYTQIMETLYLEASVKNMTKELECLAVRQV